MDRIQAHANYYARSTMSRILVVYVLRKNDEMFICMRCDTPRNIMRRHNASEFVMIVPFQAELRQTAFKFAIWIRYHAAIRALYVRRGVYTWNADAVRTMVEDMGHAWRYDLETYMKFIADFQ